MAWLITSIKTQKHCHHQTTQATDARRSFTVLSHRILFSRSPSRGHFLLFPSSSRLNSIVLCDDVDADLFSSAPIAKSNGHKRPRQANADPVNLLPPVEQLEGRKSPASILFFSIVNSIQSAGYSNRSGVWDLGRIAYNFRMRECRRFLVDKSTSAA